MRQTDSSDADLLAPIEEGNQILKEIEGEQEQPVQQWGARMTREAGLGDKLDTWIQKVRDTARERGCVDCSITLAVGWPPRIDLAFQWST